MQVAVLPEKSPTEKPVMIRLTIEADSVTRVRHAVIVACGDSTELLRTQVIPRSSQVRVWFVLAEAAVRDAMLAVLRTVRCGEIGPVIHQHQNQAAGVSTNVQGLFRTAPETRDVNPDNAVVEVGRTL
jgi:short subunit dehydrogenase-like uncharacterized protein